MKWGHKETKVKPVIETNLWRILCMKTWAKKNLHLGMHRIKNSPYPQVRPSLLSPLLQTMKLTWWSPILWKRRTCQALILKSKKIKFMKEFGVRSRKEKRSRKRRESKRWKNRPKEWNNKKGNRHNSYLSRNNRSKNLSIWRRIVWAVKTKKNQLSKAQKQKLLIKKVNYNWKSSHR